MLKHKLLATAHIITDTASWQEKLNSYLTPKRQRIILIGLLIMYTLMLTYKINEPFMRLQDEFDGTYSIAAWNWLIHGPIELKFAMMTLASNVGILPEVTRDFFLNHPSLFIAPTAAFYWLFGIGEWQTRAAPILFSLLSLIVFWKLIARVFKTPWLTIASSLFYAFFPVGIFFGGLLTNDYLALFSILSLFLAVICFEEERQKKYLIGICAITFLGGLSDWTFLFAAAAAWWYIALTKNYPQKKAALLLMIGILAASLSMTLLQIWSIARMNPFTYLKIIFSDRNVADAVIPSISRFLNMRFNFDLVLFSEIGLILAIVGAIFYFRTYKKDKVKLFFLALLAAPGLLTYAVFYKHSTAHSFYGLYMMPAIALLAAYGLGRLRNVWLARSLFALFLTSCVWYASILFSYSQFAQDDFSLFRRAGAAVPISAPICTDSSNSKFYLTPGRKVADAPCPDYSYFLLRQPQSYQNKDLLFSIVQTFYTSDFWKSARRISFSMALGVETVKSVPLLKQKLGAVFADHDPRKDNANAAKNAQAFIDEHNLQPADCSTNFCLYAKNGAPLKQNSPRLE